MKIEAPTYLIAELSGEVTLFVTSLRKKYNPDHVDWPVDVTIAGSSGVGTIQEGQEIKKVIEEFQPLISKCYFTVFEFEGIGHFPNTGIYFLKPERKLFDRMHKAVTSSTVRFNQNPFPYNPHCTLKAGHPSEEDREFNQMIFPRVASIECFSLYQPWSNGGRRIYKFEPVAPGQRR